MKELRCRLQQERNTRGGAARQEENTKAKKRFKAVVREDVHAVGMIGKCRGQEAREASDLLW